MMLQEICKDSQRHPGQAPRLLGGGPIPAARTPWEQVTTQSWQRSSQRSGGKRAPALSSEPQDKLRLHTSTWLHVQVAQSPPTFQPQLPLFAKREYEMTNRLV